MPRGRIVVIGSTNMDLYTLADRLPRPGETVLGRDFQMKPGGKGANQAVAAARAGSEVLLVSNVGDDMFGRGMTANLIKEGVAIDFVSCDRGHPTGVATIIVDAAGENMIAVAPGANMTLDPRQVDKAAEAIKSANFVLIQLEIPPAVVEHAIDIAYRQGTPVILNAAPAPADRLQKSLLAKVDTLVVNESEAAQLSGVAVVQSPSPSQDAVGAELDSVHFTPSPTRERGRVEGGSLDLKSAAGAARVLKSLGPSRIVITLGAGGAYGLSDSEVVVPARRVNVVDTVGAGDAFCGSLATALSEGQSFVDAIAFANIAGALACTRVGAQSSLPSRADIESMQRE